MFKDIDDKCSALEGLHHTTYRKSKHEVDLRLVVAELVKVKIICIGK